MATSATLTLNAGYWHLKFELAGAQVSQRWPKSNSVAVHN